MNKLILPIAFLACTCGVNAQSANPLTTGTKMIYSSIKDNILKSAEEMPESDYSFKPIDSVRSFAGMIGHVADGQYEFCSAVAGDGTKSPDVEKTVTSKADLIKALQTAFAYCDKAYAGMTDAKGVQMVPFFGGHKMAELTILQFNNVHSEEHYGNIVTYLRMKGLVPPSSQGH